MNRLLLFVHLLFLCSSILVGQEQVSDSLQKEFKKALNDTVRCKILDALIEAEGDDNVWPAYNQQLKDICEKQLKTLPPGDELYRFYMRHLAGVYNNEGYLANVRGDISRALDLYYKSMGMEEKNENPRGVATSLNNIGSIYQYQGQINKALDYYQKSLRLREQIGDEKAVGESLNNIGLLYDEQGNLSAALDCYQKARKIQEKLHDRGGLATTLVNIGAVYEYQGDLDKALAHYQASSKIQEELNDLRTLAGSLHNIGSIYRKKGDDKKALEFLQKSLKLSEQTGNAQGIAHCLNSIGSTFSSQSDLQTALSYWQQSYNAWQKLGDKQGMTITSNHLALASLKAGDMQQAESFAKQSLQFAKELGYPESILDASRTLSLIYSKTGRWKEAYESHLLFKQMSDSVNNESRRKAFLQRSLQYEYEKKVAADSIQAVEARKVFDAELKQQKVQRTALYCGIGIIALFALFMYNRFRITRKQKEIIELKELETQQQKLIIEEKHKEISDSINYAERIQRSFLATKEVLDTNLKEYFVLFKPKAVVSGDFYWASSLSNGCFSLVVADSTGHGVPGAIMSLLNITSLEKAIEQTSSPAEILNLTRNNIINRLKKDGSETGGKDGMDCSLMVFDFSARKLHIAAAHNPVWIVRDVNGKKELIESGFDKMPVGKHDKDQLNFKEFVLDIHHGDMIYAVTDGFSDQFGGEKGKKFMQKRLKETLLSLSSESAARQEKMLSETLAGWIGGLEQVDDITVLGIRI